MINKTFRLFISSTFNDFLQERTVLNGAVFDEVDRYCQNRGYNFQLIDLRWGINSESALNQNTVAICLDEVKRCRTLSPKPNFLLMIGERYGWVPIPSKIPKIDFEGLLSKATREEQDILDKWYELDENEINGEYYLKPRTGEYIQDKKWGMAENCIHNALVSCAKKEKKNPDDFLSLTSSATEQEIIEGLFNDKNICDNVISYFRTDYPEKDNDITKITKLKERILSRMEQDGCLRNIIKLKYNGCDYLETFKYKIVELLLINIEAEIDRLENESQKPDTLELIQETYLDSGSFRERKKEQDSLLKYVEDTENVSNFPLFVVGDSGSGKSTLLANFIRNFRINKSSVKIFAAFFGLDEKSYMFLDVLKKLYVDIKSEYNIAHTLNITRYNMAEVLSDAIASIPDDKKAVIIIDGIDMFQDIDEIHENLFPHVLPPNVKMIISSADESIIRKFIGNSFERIITKHFSAEESERSIYSFLTVKNRTLSSELQKKLVRNAVKNGITPLHAKLIAEQCASWHSKDSSVSIPDTVKAVIKNYFENMYTKFGHDKLFFSYAMALICESPSGITEEELQLLVFRFKAVKDYFISEDRYSHSLNKLPFVIWSRLFYDLKGCLTLTLSRGTILVKFTHNIFRSVFRNTFRKECDAARKEMMTYYAEQPDYINDESKEPNLRKALILPALLRQSGNVKSLAELYLKINFVDSVVAIGNVYEVINDILFLLEKKECLPYHKKLSCVLSCLQTNANMLSCYPISFRSYAYEYGMLSENDKPFLYRKQIEPGDRHTIFPYSRSSRLVWYSDGSRYAVLYGSYVYICSFPSGIELDRIYIGNGKPNDENTVGDFIWLNENSAVIATSNNKAKVYSFGEFASKTGFEFDYYGNGMKYDAKSGLLLYLCSKKIYAVNINTDREKNDLDLKYVLDFSSNKYYRISFDIFPDNKTLLVYMGRRSAVLYNLCTGEKINAMRIRGQMGRAASMEYMRCLSSGEILLHDHEDSRSVNSFDSFYIYNICDNKGVLLLPPQLTYEKILVGSKFIILFNKGNFISVSVDINNKFEMKAYKISDAAGDISWRVTDKSLAVVTANGIMSIDMQRFTPICESINYCKTGRKPAQNSLYIKKKSLKSRIGFINKASNLKLSAGLFEYARWFDCNADFSDENQIKKATVIAYAADGRCAAAYESADVIRVYDEKQNQLLHIDKLRLSLLNNILKLSFSPDSRYLLIWRNFSVQIIDIKAGKCILNLDNLILKYDKVYVYNVCFEYRADKTVLKIYMTNNTIYSYDLNKRNFEGEKPPDKLRNILNVLDDDDSPAGPYSYRTTDGKTEIQIILNLEAALETLQVDKALNDMRIYHSDNLELLYADGRFYTETETGIRTYFSQRFFDFADSLQIERRSDYSDFQTYLREKNDLFSSVEEIITSDKYFILICRRLNSVIVFDDKNKKIIAAYKHNGNIIGYRRMDDRTLELISDRYPYNTLLVLNL